MSDTNPKSLVCLQQSQFILTQIITNTYLHILFHTKHDNDHHIFASCTLYFCYKGCIDHHIIEVFPSPVHCSCPCVMFIDGNQYIFAACQSS